MKKLTILFILILVLLLNSCIGISYNIQLNRDGSGRISMEFRVSRILDDLGRFDGNESKPTIPIGRGDWERTIERIQGTRLVSFSSRENSQDTVTNVVIDFSNPQALIEILASSGNNVSINHNGQSGNFELIIINEQTDEYDVDIINLTRSFFNDYNFSFSFSAPGSSTMTITDGAGNTIPASSFSTSVLSGRRVSFSAGMMDVVTQTNGLGVKINW
ncbi:MAG: hypothetical protein FWD24_04940 [Treponema sp.]|nr:hypothetical protein [Treponema sp.]